MKKSILLTTAVLFAVIAMTSGCATLGGGKSDEELITEAVTAWKTAIEAENIDDMMALYSEDFEGSEGEDKAGVRQRTEGFIDGGMLADITIGLDAVEVSVDGDSASASNISIEFAQGEIYLKFDLKKEAKKTWKFISSEISGM